MPAHFNIDEAEDFGDGTRALSYANDSSLSDEGDFMNEEHVSQTSSRKNRLQQQSQFKGKHREKASTLRIKNWEFDDEDDKAYQGKVVKRESVMEVEEEVEENSYSSPDEGAMEDWSDAEPFAASSEEEEEEEELEKGEEDDNEEEDSANPDILIRNFEKEDSTILMSKKDTVKLKEKATSVRNQKIIWERCLEAQIYTKRLLTTAKPVFDVVDDVEENQEKKQQVVDKLYELIDLISNVQNNLCKHPEMNESHFSSTNKKKRKRGDIHALWDDIETDHERALPCYGSILNAATRQSNIANSGNESKKFKALNQDVLTQVDAVLADTARVKRKAHAPLAEGGEENENVLDELHYDDTDFYQQLLKEFIENGSSGMDGFTQAALLRKKKKKKIVNRKASKGRVIRYVVHPKLENFMYPEPYPKSNMDTDELFRSLFGGRNMPVLA